MLSSGSSSALPRESVTTPVSQMGLSVITSYLLNDDKCIAELDLRRRLLDVEWAKFRAFANALRSTTALKTLNVSHNSLDGAKLNVLLESLAGNRSVTNVDFSCNHISDVQPFLLLVRRNVHLQQVRIFDQSLEAPPEALTKAVQARLDFYLRANLDFQAVLLGQSAELALLGRGIKTRTCLDFGHKSLQHVQKLDLSHNILTELPPSLFELRGLRQLVVRNNRIRTISPDIAQLTELRVLNIAHNRILSLPGQALSRLKQLTAVDVSYNELLSVPLAELAGLPNLKELAVAGNVLIANVPFDVIDSLDDDDVTSFLDYVRRAPGAAEPEPEPEPVGLVAAESESRTGGGFGRRMFKGLFDHSSSKMPSSPPSGRDSGRESPPILRDAEPSLRFDDRHAYAMGVAPLPPTAASAPAASSSPAVAIASSSTASSSSSSPPSSSPTAASLCSPVPVAAHASGDTAFAAGKISDSTELRKTLSIGGFRPAEPSQSAQQRSVRQWLRPT